MTKKQVNLLAKSESKEITLSDGKTYKLSPLNLGVLASLEEEFGCPMDKIQGYLDKKQMTGLLQLLYILLKENHPSITKKEVGRLITPDILSKVSEVVKEIISY